MQKCLVRVISIVLFPSLVLGGLSFDASARPLAAISPTLGASASYSVLAGSTVTNTGPTTISGDVGVSPGTAITGFPPGIVGPPGEIHSNDASAIEAQADNLIVFGALDQTCDQTFGAVDLTTTFPDGVSPGVYCSTSSFSLTGNLTLIGSGVWIFKTVSTLITSPGSSVTGGDPCNVWWRIGSSATLDTTTSFIGNIFALTDITLNTGATLNGRALVQTGQVSLDSNIITGPICAVQPTSTPTTTEPTSTPTTTEPTSTPTSGTTSTPTTTGPASTPTTTGPASTPTTTGPTSTPTTTGPTSTPTTTGPISTPTDTPVVPGLPGSGGAPIRSDDFPWGLAIVGGFSFLALAFGIRAYRGTYRPKQ